MGNVSFAINLEFVRKEDRSFEWGVAKAAELGYTLVEPMVHLGRELLSAANYFHSISLLADPLDIRDICDEHGVKICALSAHSPLCRPDISTDYLRQALRFAAEAGAPIIVTDDGAKPAWTTTDEDGVLMRYVLHEASRAATSRGLRLLVENHGYYTHSPEGLDFVAGLADAATSLGVNFDTGNAFLSGNDPVAWLADLGERVVHIHAKDISRDDAERLRGRVWGMLGCACGDGVLDWTAIVETCRRLPQDIVLSVECGSVRDAERSLAHLTQVLSQVDSTLGTRL